MKRHVVAAVELTALYFASFHNPRARGPCFTWARFPELAAAHAAGQLGLCLGPLTARATREAADAAREFARELVRRMEEGAPSPAPEESRPPAEEEEEG